MFQAFQKHPHLFIVLAVWFSVTWQLPHGKFAQGGPPVACKHAKRMAS
jgi:hypothetical protein